MKIGIFIFSNYINAFRFLIISSVNSLLLLSFISAIFEPVHGSAPKYTNQWKVNPTAEMLTATSMLRYIGLNEKAELIEKAIFKTLEEKKVLTYDMVRILRNAGIADIKESSNKEFTEEIIRNLKALM